MFEPNHPDFLQLVRCPVTRGCLQPVSDAVISEINRKIEAGQLFNQVGQKVEWQLESVLINQEQSLFIPVREGIVSLVVDELIPSDQLDPEWLSVSGDDR
ncbi:MAG: hypothetical protein MK108_03205 [Mariniblastus sp.]|nr:hypothetical protein [Mariniblastus sp.]